jgi:hypothetical protein
MSGQTHKMSATDQVMSRIRPFSMQVTADMHTKRDFSIHIGCSMVCEAD